MRSLCFYTGDGPLMAKHNASLTAASALLTVTAIK